MWLTFVVWLSFQPAAPTLYCFSWVHGPDFSNDCYRTKKECDDANLSMQRGSRPTTKCTPESGGSCTTVSRPPDPSATQRCFGDHANCERYRGYVTGNGLTTTVCSP